MTNPPSVEALAERIRELLVETLEPEVDVDLTSPLIAGLGFDSLDMIETSFALEEFFEFEFSGRNPIVELDHRLGTGRVLSEGVLTPLGRKVLLERMPELTDLDLPDDLHATQLPQYFTILTYARLVWDFYEHAPNSCPETGELTVLDGFKILSATSRTSVATLSGDGILELWLDAKATEFAA